MFNQFLVNALKSTFTKVFIIETEPLAAIAAILATVGTAILATVLTALATYNANYSLIGMGRN
jgi:hypothetical protein